ncbi:MAG: hypothetical protein JWR32_1507 [Mycobacterium sp.]|nr:hypothetical protein [Mycobacterium sp.]
MLRCSELRLSKFVSLDVIWDLSQIRVIFRSRRFSVVAVSDAANTGLGLVGRLPLPAVAPRPHPVRPVKPGAETAFRDGYLRHDDLREPLTSRL